MLSSKGLLPFSESSTVSSVSLSKAKTRKTVSSVGSIIALEPTQRTTLIPRHVNYQFNWSVGQNKINLAWEQLQHHLELEKHKFAVAVVFRTLIDLTAQNYQNKNGMKSKESLAKDLREINEKPLNETILDKVTHRDALRIIDGGTASNSIESLQRVLHSKSH